MTVEAGITLSTPQDTVRYQYDNHLGSSCLELDENANTISYEEYHPFGTTSYRLHRNHMEASLKRYRYVGKERDEETGLYYYGARYYAAHIARFVSVDPLQHKYPHYTPYQYAGNKPITFIDLDGLEEAFPDNNKNKAILFTNQNIFDATTKQEDNKNWIIQKAENLEVMSEKLSKYKSEGIKINTVFISTHGFNNRLSLAGLDINSGVAPIKESTISPQTIKNYILYKELIKNKTQNQDKINELIGEDPMKQMYNDLNFVALEQLEKIVENIENNGVLIFGACFSGNNPYNEQTRIIDALGELFENRINIILPYQGIRTKGPYLNAYIEDSNESIGWQIRTTKGEVNDKKGYSLILSKNSEKSPILWKNKNQ